MQYDRGSFRDRHGRVVHQGGEVLRLLSAQALEHFSRLEQTRFWRARQQDGSVVGTRRLSDDPRLIELSEGQPQWAGLLSHDRIPFVSYPYEWSFGMLKDAAALTLSLLHDALEEGFILKDATSYNVQWRGAQPTFIDIPSLEVLTPGQPWVGYRQFCELFLFPLLLAAYRSIDYRPWLRGRVDGVPPADAAAVFSSWRDWLRKGVFTHVYLQAKLEERQQGAQRKAVREDLKRAGFNVELIKANVRGLRRLVERLSWAPATTEWADYTSFHNYSAEDHRRKEAFVEQAAESVRPKLAYDLGANTGQFARVLARLSDYVVAMDIDPLAVDRMYQQQRSEAATNILPLVMNLADPSPGLGWRGAERSSLLDRGRPDLVIALALVHHIVISANVPVDEFTDLLGSFGAAVVVEFVDKGDEQVGKLLANKDDQYHDYERAGFERSLARHFTIERQEDLREGLRTLYFLKPHG